MHSIVLDTGAPILSTVGIDLAGHTAKISGHALYVSNTTADNITLSGVGNIRIRTLGAIVYPFWFGGIEYMLNVYLVPGRSVFLLSHRDMDLCGLSYHSLEKVVTRPADSYSQKEISKNELPQLPLEVPCNLTMAQLRRIHTNLGHARSDRVLSLLRAARWKISIPTHERNWKTLRRSLRSPHSARRVS